MSERREKKRRYIVNLAYTQRFENWLKREPPMIRFFAWRRWLKERPIREV